MPAYEPGRDVQQMTPESASLRMLTLSAWSWSDETLSVALELPVLAADECCECDWCRWAAAMAGWQGGWPADDEDEAVEEDDEPAVDDDDEEAV